MNWNPPPRTDTNYIRTISGKRFWPLNPRPEDVDIEDIAHALSLTCRFNRHVPYLYSVGQHSLNVYYHSRLLWGLLHDATEAYLPDVPRTIKDDLPFFHTIEHQLHCVIAQAFHLDAGGVDLVKEHDYAILHWERQHFGHPAFDNPPPFHPGTHTPPPYVVLQETHPVLVQARFLYEFERAMLGKGKYVRSTRNTHQDL